MSEINTNTPTTETEVELEKASGDISFSSFDELEALDRAQKTQDKTDKKADKADKSDKKLDPSAEKKAQDGKENKDAKAAKDDRDTEQAAAKDDTNEKAKADKPVSKNIKAKSGENEIEIPLDAQVAVAVNGKDESVSIEELKKNYSGKVAWDARFSKLGNQEKQFEQKTSAFVSKAKAMLEAASKDGLEGLAHLAEMTGVDPIEYRKKFIENIRPGLEKYAAMTEDERKAHDAEFETQQLKREVESHRKAKTDQDAIKALETKVTNLQQTHQFNNETFEKTFNELVAMQAKGELKVDVITPEIVAEVIVEERRLDAISTTIDELNLNLEAEKREKIIGDAVEIARSNPSFSLDDLKEAIKEVWGNQRAKNVSRKVNKTLGESSSRQSGNKPANPGTDPLSFDEL